VALKPALAVLVFAWGAAEAMLFFVVPDVPITLLAARTRLRAACRASLWATAGAVLGGTVLYHWAGADPAGVARMLDLVPAVSVAQIASAKQQMADDWITATLVAGFSGDPYKLYAAAAGEQGLSLLPFLAISVLARLSRFIGTAALARGFTIVLERRGHGRWALPLIGLFWIGFYAWYWTSLAW
jgi:membrane protein YqaA with SNARE-associated domain